MAYLLDEFVSLFPDYTQLLDEDTRTSLQKLKENLPAVEDDAPNSSIFQVEAKSRTQIAEESDALGKELLRLGHDMKHTVPARIKANQDYDTILRRNVLIDGGNDVRRLVITVDRVGMTKTVLANIGRMCRNNTRCTMRRLYYNGVLRHEWTVAQVNAIVNDVCCLLRCDRDSLHLEAAKVGEVIGPLAFMHDEMPIHCMGPVGYPIPRLVDQVRDLRTTAMFILLVEKDTVFSHLAESGFHKKFPCIMVTGNGQGGIATKKFLRKLSIDLKLPVLGLFDSDIDGIIALVTYVVGSINLSFDSRNMVTPNIKWLGMRTSDFRRFNIPGNWLKVMTERDLRLAKGWENRSCFDMDRAAWNQEIKEMIKLERSAGLESLDQKVDNANYLSEVYLPEKLKWGLWI